MKIIGYARLSRASRDESTSIARQKELIAVTCAARGHILVDTIVDNDVSATKTRLERPGLNEVRARIASGEADAVMVWRLDRLVRSVVDVGILLDGGLNIVSATEAFDTTTSMGRAMVEISQVFAAMESKTAGIRIAASQAYLRKEGRWPGGVVPYGYRAVTHPHGAGKALEPHPLEAAIVRRMADDVLGGLSVYATTARLNASNVLTRRPWKKADAEEGADRCALVRRHWEPTTVARILRSDAVLGRVRAGGVHREGKVITKATPIRDEDGLPVVHWEPLLEVYEVERLRQLTDWTPTPGRAEATAAGRRKRASRLLSGLLECFTCGGPLIAKSRNSTGRPVYTCDSRARGRVCERAITIEALRAEAEVERKFLEAVGRLPVTEVRTSLREPAALASAEEAIRETTEAMRAPGADLHELAGQLSTLHATRQRLAERPHTPIVEHVETGQTFAESWLAQDTMGRRGLLIASGAHLGVGPARRGNWDPNRVTLEFGPSTEDYDAA